MGNVLLKKNNKVDVSEFFMAVAYFSLAIVSSYDSFLTFDTSFPSSIIFIVLLLTGIVCAGLIGNISFNLHPIVFLLLLRCLLYLINAILLNIDKEKKLEQLFITLSSILIFEISYSKELSIKNILKPFLLMTDIQIFYSFISSNFSFSKTVIVAGIGDSNYIATFILLCVSYMLFSRTNLVENLLIIISIVALLLTQSFACYLALIFMLFIWITKKINLKSLSSVIKAIVCAIIAIGFVILFLSSKYGVPIVSKVKSKLDFLLEGNINAFSSSRIELYKYSISNIKRNIIFGTIDNFSIDKLETYRYAHARTHNFILESLLQYGIVGSLLNLIILYYIFKSFKIRETFACKMAFIAVLIHGFFEPNFFTLHFELFIWLIIGSSLRISKDNLINARLLKN